MTSDPHKNASRAAGRAARTDAKASEFTIRRYDRGTWTESDQAELDAWLSESSANRTAFLRLKSAWLRANRLDALRPMSPRGMPGQKSSQQKIRLAAGAMLLVLLSGTGWFLSRASIQTFSTKIGERRHVQLSDGTRVELTTDTILRVATQGAQRKAWLDKGEAFFEVVHDDAHPFELQTLNYRIVDLGTEFSVRRETDRIKVTVLKGSVRVDTPNAKVKTNAVSMTAGEVAVADNRSINVTRKSSADISDSLGWRNGVLVFRYAPLSEVAAEFNRYNDEKIVVDDKRVSRTIISARLQATDVEAFARMARDFMGLQVRHDGDEIHISRRPDEH